MIAVNRRKIIWGRTPIHAISIHIISHNNHMLMELHPCEEKHSCSPSLWFAVLLFWKATLGKPDLFTLSGGRSISSQGQQVTVSRRKSGLNSTKCLTHIQRTRSSDPERKDTSKQRNAHPKHPCCTWSYQHCMCTFRGREWRWYMQPQCPILIIRLNK